MCINYSCILKISFDGNEIKWAGEVDSQKKSQTIYYFSSNHNYKRTYLELVKRFEPKKSEHGKRNEDKRKKALNIFLTTILGSAADT